MFRRSLFFAAAFFVLLGQIPAAEASPGRAKHRNVLAEIKKINQKNRKLLKKLKREANPAQKIAVSADDSAATACVRQEPIAITSVLDYSPFGAVAHSPVFVFVSVVNTDYPGCPASRLVVGPAFPQSDGFRADGAAEFNMEPLTSRSTFSSGFFSLTVPPTVLNGGYNIPLKVTNLDSGLSGSAGALMVKVNTTPPRLIKNVIGYSDIDPGKAALIQGHYLPRDIGRLVVNIMSIRFPGSDSIYDNFPNCSVTFDGQIVDSGYYYCSGAAFNFQGELGDGKGRPKPGLHKLSIRAINEVGVPVQLDRELCYPYNLDGSPLNCFGDNIPQRLSVNVLDGISGKPIEGGVLTNKQGLVRVSAFYDEPFEIINAPALYLAENPISIQADPGFWGGPRRIDQEWGNDTETESAVLVKSGGGPTRLQITEKQGKEWWLPRKTLKDLLLCNPYDSNGSFIGCQVSDIFLGLVPDCRGKPVILSNDSEQTTFVVNLPGPYGGMDVTLDFSDTNLRLAKDPANGVDCGAKEIKFKASDYDTSVIYNLRFGGYASGDMPLVKVKIGGLVVGEAEAHSVDLDGDGQVGANDLSLWLTLFGQNDSGGDFDLASGETCSPVGANDLSILLSAFGAGAAPREMCPL